MTDPVAPLSEHLRIDTSYGLMPVLPLRAEHGKIHSVDERTPLSKIAEMTEIGQALIRGWSG